MRAPLILALSVLTIVVVSLLTKPPAKPQPAAAPVTPQMLQGYRIGHDWVEPPPEVDGKHPLLKGDWHTKTEFQCTQPECRTCQWMRLFGGEW